MKQHDRQLRASSVFFGTFRRVALSMLIPLLFMSLCILTVQTTQSFDRLGVANTNVLVKDDQLATMLLESLDRNMESLVRDPTVVDFAVRPHVEDTKRNAELCAVLENLAKTYPFILEGTLISHFENLQLTSDGLIHYGVSDEWNDCITKGRVLSGGLGVWITRLGNTRQLYLYRTVPYGSIGNLATLYLRIDLGEFFNTVAGEGIQENPSQKLAVYSTDGLMLFSTDKDSMEDLEPLFRKMSDGTSDTVLKLQDGGPLLCSLIRNRDFGWSYFFAEPALSNHSNSFALALPILISVLAACGIGLLLAYQESKELYRPLEELVASLPEPNARGEDASNEYQRLASYYDRLVNRKNEVYEQVQTIKSLLREKFLVSLTDERKIALEKIQYQLKLLELPFQKGRFAALMLQFDHYQDLPYSEEEKRDIKEQLRALIATDAFDSLDCFSAETGDETMLVLCSAEMDDSDSVAQWAVHAMAEQLQREAQTSWAVSVTIGIGGVYQDAGDLQTTCLNAKRALSYQIFRGMGCIIDYRDVESADAQYDPVNYEEIQQLVNTVRLGDEKNTRVLLRQIFGSFEDVHRVLPEKLQTLLKQLTTALPEVLQSAQIPPEDVLPPDFERDAAVQKTLPDSETWLTELYCRAASAIRMAHSDHTRSNAEKIKRYIDENLTKDISLTSVSEYVGYSPTYVGKIFRQQYGVSYVDYLNSGRVSAAKKLLATTELSIKEIGFQVGFNNLQTYFRIFKKYTNTTPLQFRESLHH